MENSELGAIASNLIALNKELVAPKAPRGNDPQSRDAAKSGEQLRELCSGCDEVSRKLLSVIQQLEHGRGRSKWKSFRQALLTLWKEKEIEDLSKRLERYRSQIDTALLVSLRYYIQERQSASNSLAEEINKGTFINRIGDIKKIQLELADILETRQWQLQSLEDIQLFSSKVSESADCAREERAASQIFEKLRFQGMEARFEHIPEAYRRTFDWIFQNDQCRIEGSSNSANTMVDGNINFSRPRSRRTRRGWNSFVQWLQGDQTLYWITGKPGSGKSTLMKYLSVHPKTIENLTEWTGGQQATLAGFFFWNSGTVMQMSEMGLFQSLLYQAIEDHQEIIPTLFPERWKQYELFGNDLRPWSLHELSKALEIMVSDSSRKFFFFIDGLDEFDGNEGKLAKFILDIASVKHNVKMCVASRPWLVFEDAFYLRPSLRLEDLTAPDIQNFVSGNLGGNRMFSNLQKARPREAAGLVLEVTEKACGVFLWVHLVVLSLLQGLRDGDSIADLRERLLLLPSDLEELFEKIIGSVSPSYLEQACMIFQCLRTTLEPLSLLDLSLAQENFDQAMIAEVKSMDPSEVDFRAETMRRRLNSRCRGLVEAPEFDEEGPDAKIQYLHRTVKDFLATKRDWEIRAASERNGFHPDLALCGGYLFHLKVMSRDKSLFLDEFWRVFANCLLHFDHFKLCAVYGQNLVIDKYLSAHSDFINELQRVGDELLESTHPDGGKWLDVLVADGRDMSLFNHSRVTHWHESGPIHETNFPKYALNYELLPYVKSRLKAGSEINLQGRGSSLLHRAVLEQDVHLVELLLKHGVNPNSRYGNATLWHNVMARASEPFDAGSKEKWVVIVELFLKHHAKSQITVHNQSVRSIIKATCQDWDDMRVDQLLGKVPKPGPDEKNKAKRSFPALKRMFRRSG